MQQIEYQGNAFHNTSAETSNIPGTCVMILSSSPADDRFSLI